ncbi:UNVERIFIED_CONTAM: ribosomal protein L7/L12 [Jeotgalibacillus campisalis]
MGMNFGDVLTIVLPLLVLVGLLWALTAAFKPRDTGLSDAEKYQRELAARSAAHQASQVQEALALRARIEATTKPSQNVASQREQAENARTPIQAQTGRPGSQTGQQPAVLPNGQLNPQLAFELQNLVRSGKRIEAIKVLRQATHSDLLTAKNYVDRL